MNISIANSWVDIVTCVAMLVGGIYAWIQWRKSRVISRNIFLQGLLKDIGDYEDVWRALTAKYGGESKDRFDFEDQVKVDTLLRHYSQVCFMKASGAISSQEFVFFAFRIRQILSNEIIARYLSELALLPEVSNCGDHPFAPLVFEGSGMNIQSMKEICKVLQRSKTRRVKVTW